MHYRKYLSVAVSTAVLAVGSTSGFAQSLAQRQLIEQAQYWQQRDATRATQAWNKLLQADPASPEALVGLGRLAVQAKDAGKAQAYLAQLKKAHPQHPDVALLEQDIALMGREAASSLDQAHIFMRQENAEEAVKHYRKMFGGREPQGKLGAEYYSVLGYTKEGWAEAVAGLERLRKRSPDDPQISLALAKLWILRDDTRTQGIRTLAALSRRQDVGGDATEQWREVLTWLGAPPPPSAAPLFEEYLKANPEDDEIRAQYRAKRPTSDAGRGRAATAPARDPFLHHLDTGFAALRAGNVAEAEPAFSAALRLRPKDAGALGGMGLVRLQQKAHGEARALLAQASERGEAAQWKQALDTATYWDLVDRARVARRSDALDDAVHLLEQALRLDPGEATAAVELGDAYLVLQSYEDAKRVWRAVLAREPHNVAALQGLVAALAATGRADEAVQLIDGLDPAVRERIDVGRLRAERSVAEGRAAAGRGDLVQARSRFEDAVAQSPDDPWLRLELARLLQRAGKPADARAVTDALLRDHTGAEALYVAALVHAEQQDWAGALELSGRIAPSARTEDMKALHRRASLQAGLARARQLAQRGDLAQARAALAPLLEQAAADPDAVSAVAQGYADAGDGVRARALLREALGRERPPRPGLLLQYAGLLLRLEESGADFVDAMRTLRSMDLSAPQRLQYESLQRGHALRQADLLRQQGRLAQAYESLRPLLNGTPDDPMVLAALARLHVDAGNPAEALTLYRSVLAQTPNDLGTLQAAGGVAMAVGDHGTAERLFMHALGIAPGDPQVLTALAQLYRQQGRDSKALPLLRQAEAALRSQWAAQTSTPAGATPVVPRPGAADFPADNPFAAIGR